MTISGQSDQAPFDAGPPSGAAEAKLTPMMAQYIEIKTANSDCLLFYRMGDFYELFFEDAEIASRTLGIVLTKRGKHLGEDIPMCGVPVERADDYLQRLIAAGHRVAVCEQMEDPAEARKRGAKSVVRRGVTRLVTPGTITEESLLEPGRANMLCSLSRLRREDAGWTYGIAAVDISTGHFVLSSTTDAGLAGTLARLDPREIILPDTLRDDPAIEAIRHDMSCAFAPLARDGYDAQTGEDRLKHYFGVATLEAFGRFSRAELAAAGAVITYIDRTQMGARPPLRPPVRESEGAILEIDASSRANLELIRTLAGERAGSLLAAIDRTVTPAGGRLLAERLSGPITDLAELALRHRGIEEFVGNDTLRDALRDALRRAPDMPRALARLALQRGGPRDLAAIRDGIGAATVVERLLRHAGSELAESVRRDLAALDETVAALLGAALDDDLPLNKRDGGFVRAGFEPALDEARGLKNDSRQVITGLQAAYAGQTDCRTLKVKYNNFLGYFIEVPQSVGERLVQPPLNATFVHRQTMAGAMRFSTAELGELEAKIASAGERATGLELGIFDRLTDRVLAAETALRTAADALAVLDVTTALAHLAADLGWTRPQLTQRPEFHVEGARHPVVEAAVRARGGSFTANDCELGSGAAADAGRILLVTGPNMAGKSTYLRQNALIAILAQMGSFVPARLARLGIVDRLFSRVGAADDLARGRSTFMVEMVETATILNQATERSLVILDEIGRGTATYDGLSIAWATVEHLHEVSRCRALFATHFHELTALSRRLPRLCPVTMRVTEHRGDVVFLHEVVPGSADRSYGIQVAKLAGLPAKVVARARQLLGELEKGDRNGQKARVIDELPLFAAKAEDNTAPVTPVVDPLREAMASIDPDALSPREALEALYRLKQIEKTG